MKKEEQEDEGKAGKKEKKMMEEAMEDDEDSSIASSSPAPVSPGHSSDVVVAPPPPPPLAPPPSASLPIRLRPSPHRGFPSSAASVSPPPSPSCVRGQTLFVASAVASQNDYCRRLACPKSWRTNNNHTPHPPPPPSCFSVSPSTCPPSSYGDCCSSRRSYRSRNKTFRIPASSPSCTTRDSPIQDSSEKRREGERKKKKKKKREAEGVGVGRRREGENTGPNHPNEVPRALILSPSSSSSSRQIPSTSGMTTASSMLAGRRRRARTTTTTTTTIATKRGEGESITRTKTSQEASGGGGGGAAAASTLHSISSFLSSTFPDKTIRDDAGRASPSLSKTFRPFLLSTPPSPPPSSTGIINSSSGCALHHHFDAALHRLRTLESIVQQELLPEMESLQVELREANGTHPEEIGTEIFKTKEEEKNKNRPPRQGAHYLTKGSEARKEEKGDTYPSSTNQRRNERSKEKRQQQEKEYEEEEERKVRKWERSIASMSYPSLLSFFPHYQTRIEEERKKAKEREAEKEDWALCYPRNVPPPPPPPSCGKLLMLQWCPGGGEDVRHNADERETDGATDRGRGYEGGAEGVRDGSVPPFHPNFAPHNSNDVHNNRGIRNANESNIWTISSLSSSLSSSRLISHLF